MGLYLSTGWTLVISCNNTFMSNPASQLNFWKGAARSNAALKLQIQRHLFITCSYPRRLTTFSYSVSIIQEPTAAFSNQISLKYYSRTWLEPFAHHHSRTNCRRAKVLFKIVTQPWAHHRSRTNCSTAKELFKNVIQPWAHHRSRTNRSTTNQI